MVDGGLWALAAGGLPALEEHLRCCFQLANIVEVTQKVIMGLDLLVGVSLLDLHRTEVIPKYLR